MDNSLKGLILAAGVIITCLVVGLGFYISREAKNTSSNGISQITSMNGEYQDVNKTMYDGVTVSGREVLKVIEKYREELSKGDFTIAVYTGKKGTEKGGIIFNTQNYSTSEARKIKSDSYINPDGSFVGELSQDENGAISRLSFTQQ